MNIPAINQSGDTGLFLSWRHCVSHRTAILKERDGMAWLYLSEPQIAQPARDCPAFVTTIPSASTNWEHVEKSGEPPGISKDIASDQAVIEHPSPEDFACIWSADGESVGLQYRGNAICMIIGDKPRGYSKSLAHRSPIGDPFDEHLYTAIFTSECGGE